MFGELIKQNYFIVACYIITALYVGFSNTLLTDKIKNILNNEITKLILLALIILVGEHSIELSIALTIVVLVSLLVANSHSKENFLNETFMDTDENKEDMYKEPQDDSNEDKADDDDDEDKEINDNTSDVNDNTSDSNDNMDDTDSLSCPAGCQPIPQNNDNMNSDLKESD